MTGCYTQRASRSRKPATVVFNHRRLAAAPEGFRPLASAEEGTGDGKRRRRTARRPRPDSRPAAEALEGWGLLKDKLAPLDGSPPSISSALEYVVGQHGKECSGFRHACHCHYK